MTGWVVLAASCLATAVFLAVAPAWRRARYWRYPDSGQVQLGDELVGPPSDEVLALWAVHDPTPLGFTALGVVRAPASWGEHALIGYWVDEATRTTVAALTFHPGRRGGDASCRRTFTTFLGEVNEPSLVRTRRAATAMVHDVPLPDSRVLHWPARDQAELLALHRRQLLLSTRESLRVPSLDDLRLVAASAQREHQRRVIESGRVRRRRDGQLVLGLRARLRSVARQLPTYGAAIRRADQRAREIVADWPQVDPSS